MAVGGEGTIDIIVTHSLQDMIVSTRIWKCPSQSNSPKYPPSRRDTQTNPVFVGTGAKSVEGGK